MKMYKVIHTNKDMVVQTHKNEHEKYEYKKGDIVSPEQATQCTVSVYELPPGKSAYPYHYHTNNEEVYYILHGEGVLRTSEGEKCVYAGDFIFFPANEKGAHKLTNISTNENLVYIDFHTRNEIDVCFYPDSGKIGIWGKEINQLYKVEDKVNYYDGE